MNDIKSFYQTKFSGSEFKSFFTEDTRAKKKNDTESSHRKETSFANVRILKLEYRIVFFFQPKDTKAAKHTEEVNRAKTLAAEE